VRLFRRKRDDEPVDPDERSPQLGLRYKDLAVLGQLTDAGADLSQSRHVVYYSYAPTEETARSMADEAEAKGFTTDVRTPLPEYPHQWSVIAETHAVCSPEFVRQSDDFFQELADRLGGEYDGWEAGL
jgi:hypothetical protein